MCSQNKILSKVCGQFPNIILELLQIYWYREMSKITDKYSFYPTNAIFFQWYMHLVLNWLSSDYQL